MSHAVTSKKPQLKTQVLCLSVGQVVMMLGVDCILLSGEYEPEMLLLAQTSSILLFLPALSCFPLLFSTSLKKMLFFSLCFSCNTSKELKLETTGKTQVFIILLWPRYSAVSLLYL